MYSRLMTLSILATAMAMAQTGYGRSRGGGDREGLNFGSTARIVTTDDTALANGSTIPMDSNNKSATEALTPYVGYSFGGTLNLGVFATVEHTNTHVKNTDSAGSIEVTREIDTTRRGAGIQARFLFAEVMFFEAGLGLYDQTMRLSSEEKNYQNGEAFEGTREGLTIRGIGPGYHGAFGIEIPVTHGFYFTTSYTSRRVLLRDTDGSSGQLGPQRIKANQREIAFGLSYYDN